MIKSMTGFGRDVSLINEKEYTIEIKTVNHKYNDISVRMPRSISYLEEKVRQEICKKISRGKIDVFINLTNYSQNDKQIKVNTEIAKTYIEELKKLAQESNITDDISVISISKLPDVLVIENKENEEELLKDLLTSLNKAIDNIVSMKEMEGSKLKIDLETRLEKICGLIEEINKNSTGLVEEYIVKLENRIKQMLKTDVIDKERLAQEVVIFSDKCSIEEELTRLDSHIHQFKNLLETNGPIGKKLDFIVQEMNRETNTIGSKANSLDITNLVINIKTEIENIREQIQNIE